MFVLDEDLSQAMAAGRRGAASARARASSERIPPAYEKRPETLVVARSGTSPCQPLQRKQRRPVTVPQV